MIHAGELMPDGMPRFHEVYVLVSRQNGKTEVPVMLVPFWMFVDRDPLILGTSTKLEYAKESWDKARKLIQRSPFLKHRIPDGRWYVRGNANVSMWSNDEESRYTIAAANEEGGRSLTIHKLVMDELRQHHDYSAYNAAEPATEAVWDSQVWALSNAGDDRSVVLNDKVAAALAFIQHGRGNGRIGLFAWTAEDDADPTDLRALAQANPNLGLRIDPERLLEKGRAAVETGGEALTGFKTESMCIRVKVSNPAIDPGAWLRCMVQGDLSAVRNRVACCLDVSPDGAHVTLAAAAVLPDGRVRGEVVGSWSSTARARQELPALVRTIRPQALGWFPAGPGAALAADLTPPTESAQRAWNAMAQPIRGDMAAACMGLEELVRGGQFWHSGDPLLDAHVAEAERKKRGDAWVFVRHGDGHVDAAYAMAGAAHLARTLPPPIGKPRLIVAGGS